MKPSPFLRGVGSILDIFGTTPVMSKKSLKKLSKTVRTDRSISEALSSDWDNICKDFSLAYKKTIQNTPTSVDVSTKKEKC